MLAVQDITSVLAGVDQSSFFEHCSSRKCTLEQMEFVLVVHILGWNG